MFVTALSDHTNQDRTASIVCYINIPPNFNTHTQAVQYTELTVPVRNYET